MKKVANRFGTSAASRFNSPCSHSLDPGPWLAQSVAWWPRLVARAMPSPFDEMRDVLGLDDSVESIEHVGLELVEYESSCVFMTDNLGSDSVPRTLRRLRECWFCGC